MGKPESPEPRHQNCFDLLRLLLAASVVYTHAYLLCGSEEPTHNLFKRQLSVGSIAVLGFFGVSGYLVTASWQRSSGIWSFLKKRALRIFPGFWVCLLFVAFLVGPLLYVARSKPLSEYPLMGSEGAVRYVLSNSMLMVNQWVIGDRESVV